MVIDFTFDLIGTVPTNPYLDKVILHVQKNDVTLLEELYIVKRSPDTVK